MFSSKNTAVCTVQVCCISFDCEPAVHNVFHPIFTRLSIEGAGVHLIKEKKLEWLNWESNPVYQLPRQLKDLLKHFQNSWNSIISVILGDCNYLQLFEVCYFKYCKEISYYFHPCLHVLDAMFYRLKCDLHLRAACFERGLPWNKYGNQNIQLRITVIIIYIINRRLNINALPLTAMSELVNCTFDRYVGEGEEFIYTKSH